MLAAIKGGISGSENIQIKAHCTEDDKGPSIDQINSCRDTGDHKVLLRVSDSVLQ